MYYRVNQVTGGRDSRTPGSVRLLILLPEADRLGTAEDGTMLCLPVVTSVPIPWTETTDWRT